MSTMVSKWLRPVVVGLLTLALCALTASCEDLGAGSSSAVVYDTSSSAIDTFFIGERLYTSNWRTVPFEGTGNRAWTNTGTNFMFEWNTVAGDQIGRIGRNVDSDAAGSLQVSNIPVDYRISATATLSNLHSSGSGWYIWAVYGWTHWVDVTWPITGDDTNEGWDNEFYIVLDTNLPYLTPPSAGYIAQGIAVIDGVTYNFYRNNMSWGADNQTQWMAVAQTPWPGSAPVSVDVQKFLDHWATTDPPSIPAEDYLVDLTLAVEAFEGSRGRLTLSDIVIP